MAGLIGHGDAFFLRDPAGISPAYYFKNDEVVVDGLRETSNSDRF